MLTLEQRKELLRVGARRAEEYPAHVSGSLWGFTWDDEPARYAEDAAFG